MHQVYGIPNCQTVKKALTWLDENQQPYTFHDFKKEGVTAQRLNGWAKVLGWDNLLNRRGTTWRTLSTEEQAMAGKTATLRQLLQAKTSLIRRPVIEWDDGTLTVGFDPANFSERV